MFQLLAKIVPLGFASALSPGILALVVFMLGKKHAKPRIWALFIGTIAVALIIVVLGFVTGSGVSHGGAQKYTSALIDIVLGTIFMYFAIKNILGKERSLKESKEDLGPQFVKWLLIGLLINATNFDAVFLIFSAAKEIGSASVSVLDKIIAVVINVFFFSLPVTLPVAIYLIFPKTAQIVLGKLNQILMRYSKYIIFAMFAIFGLIFLYRGVKFFI